MVELIELRRAAREIFETTLCNIDAGDALRGAVKLEGSRLTIVETVFDLARDSAGVYAIAIGKAARPMAIALDEILDEQLTAGVLAEPPTAATTEETSNESLDASPAGYAFNNRWRKFAGGHPLPNQSSLDAARACFELLRSANDKRALVIFLISGGGSAIMEWPRDPRTTLDELRVANRALVSCGATIAEINSVRRTLSALKGGALAAHAPRSDQMSLIISDTEMDQEYNVASGPSLNPPPDAPDAVEVVARYGLASRLPASILRMVNESTVANPVTSSNAVRKYHVLLDNESALKAAAAIAGAKGFTVKIAHDLLEQPVATGCAELLSRLFTLQHRTTAARPVACLISGGEFACSVRGTGTGGRNSETALHCAIELDRHVALRAGNEALLNHIVALSAGTDGIDGNSPAAGALADETTVARARALGLDAQRFLDESDAYTFFHALGDAIMTGPTGTNVRDLRIMLAS